MKRNAYSKVAVATPITKSYASGTVTIGHANSGVTAGTYDSVTVDAQGHVTAGSNYTIDSTPTVNSQNLVTSGGVYEDQQRQEVEIGAVANRGAKNLLNVTALSGVLNTATIDIADDGSIHISGRPTSSGAYVLSSGIDLVIPENAYILSMGAEAGDTKISLSLRRKGTTQYVDLYHAESRIIPSGTYDRAHIYLYSDTDYDTVVYPMIRPASITDSTFQPYALPNPTLTPAAIKAVDEGAKNLVNAPSGSDVRFINIPIVLQPGDYYVLFQNITSTDTDASTCQFGAFANDNSQASNYPQLKRGDNTGAMFTVRKQTSYVRLYAANDFAKGAGDTVTFTGCMICTAADWAVSQKFVPYAPTNKTVYDDQQRQEVEIGVVANAGAKNLADFNFGGVVQNVNVKPGTIVCIESNGTFSFSGTSDYKNYAAYVLKQFLLKAGTYKISGISGGSNTTYWMRIGTDTTDTVLFNLYDAEREFNIASDTLITVQVVIYANQTVSNLVFKPMIRPAAIIDSTFQPYAPTNRELYEMIQMLQNNS